MGFTRVGCIGCPMAGKGRWKELQMFPKYQKMYIHAFDRMLKARKSKKRSSDWKNGEEVFLWWMEDKELPGQYVMEVNATDLTGGFKEK